MTVCLYLVLCLCCVLLLFLLSIMLIFLQVSMSVSLTLDRIAGMVQLDQVIARSFAVPLLRNWPIFDGSPCFECYFFTVKSPYSYETTPCKTSLTKETTTLHRSSILSRNLLNYQCFIVCERNWKQLTHLYSFPNEGDIISLFVLSVCSSVKNVYIQLSTLCFAVVETAVSLLGATSLPRVLKWGKIFLLFRLAQ